VTQQQLLWLICFYQTYEVIKNELLCDVHVSLYLLKQINISSNILFHLLLANSVVLKYVRKHGLIQNLKNHVYIIHKYTQYGLKSIGSGLPPFGMQCFVF
jgi:hypothetical protein